MDERIVMDEDVLTYIQQGSAVPYNWFLPVISSSSLSSL